MISRAFVGVWIFRVVLFVLGFVGCRVVIAAQWWSSASESPRQAWSGALLLTVSLLGGLASAACGRWFWRRFDGLIF
jgi:hypothetical protein